MVNKIDSEISFVYADIATAGQVQKERFPRSQAIRSFFVFADLACVQAAVILEVLSGLEVISEIKTQWDDHEVVVRGDEIAATQWAFFGTTPIVGGGCYQDGLAAGATLDFDAIFRIPIGATASPTTNIEVSMSMAGEAVWSETVASTSGSGTIYITADYVDNVSVSYDTWNDTMDNIAAMTERQPPAKGDTIVGFSVVCRDDYAAYTAQGVVRNFETLDANYESALTAVQVNVGERVVDVTSPECFLIPASILRRHPVTAVTTERPQETIYMTGMYWVPLNMAVNALPRIRLNAGTSDLRLNVWYSTVQGASPSAKAVQGSGSVPGEGKPETGQASSAGGSPVAPPVLRGGIERLGAPGGIGGFVQAVR